MHATEWQVSVWCVWVCVNSAFKWSHVHFSSQSRPAGSDTAIFRIFLDFSFVFIFGHFCAHPNLSICLLTVFFFFFFIFQSRSHYTSNIHIAAGHSCTPATAWQWEIYIRINGWCGSAIFRWWKIRALFFAYCCYVWARGLHATPHVCIDMMSVPK